MSNFTAKKRNPFASISLPQLPHVSLPETTPPSWRALQGGKDEVG